MGFEWSLFWSGSYFESGSYFTEDPILKQPYFSVDPILEQPYFSVDPILSLHLFWDRLHNYFQGLPFIPYTFRNIMYPLYYQQHARPLVSVSDYAGHYDFLPPPRRRFGSPSPRRRGRRSPPPGPRGRSMPRLRNRSPERHRSAFKPVKQKRWAVGVNWGMGEKFVCNRVRKSERWE